MINHEIFHSTDRGKSWGNWQLVSLFHLSLFTKSVDSIVVNILQQECEIVTEQSQPCRPFTGPE